MTYITDYNASGYTGSFSVTTGGYVFAGTVTTDKDNIIKSLTCDITASSNNAKVGSLSLYFSNNVQATQEAVAALIDTVIGDLYTDLGTI